jgi:uncharacterized membrane protein YtjA (UPF0391 family)
MNLIRTILTELWGLFVDDGALAAALVLWGVGAGLGLPLTATPTAWQAPILFLGFLVILLVNVLLAARKRGLVRPES